MTFKNFLINYIYAISYSLAIIYAATIISHYSIILVKSIKKYIMFRRYRYLSIKQLNNIDYGIFSKITNNRIQAMRNYIFIRDTWPYIKGKHYEPIDFITFEDWVSWIHNNYYEDNIQIIQCLYDILEGKTQEELVSNTEECIKMVKEVTE